MSFRVLFIIFYNNDSSKILLSRLTQGFMSDLGFRV